MLRSAPAFWYKTSLLGLVLAPLGWIYGLGGILGQKLTITKRLPVPVICVGNLVTGGAGKTPTVLALYHLLKAIGLTPHILSRGYGRKKQDLLQVNPYLHTYQEVGDEPLLLSQIAPTWVFHDRYLAGKKAIESGADILLLDDGYSNPRLFKDASFLVINLLQGLGNMRVLPAGPLREFPRQAWQRANAIILVGGEQKPTYLPTYIPVLEAMLCPKLPLSLKNRPEVIAFAGIGYPPKFLQTLRELGLTVKKFTAFPDHHPYTTADIQHLSDTKLPLVTTAKDWVRLPELWQKKVHEINLELRFRDPAMVKQLLKSFFKPVPQQKI